MPPKAVPGGARWSPISGSANIDTANRQLQLEPEKAYAYVCWCRPLFVGRGKDKARCDAGKTCPCGKLAQDHPSHQWISTFSCRRKFMAQVVMARMRDPDNFDMHTFRHHDALGIMELVENLLLDFVEADGNWREQWVVCETMALFLHTDLTDAMWW